jgi:hypothetical protein
MKKVKRIKKKKEKNIIKEAIDIEKSKEFIQQTPGFLENVNNISTKEFGKIASILGVSFATLLGVVTKGLTEGFEKSTKSVEEYFNNVPLIAEGPKLPDPHKYPNFYAPESNWYDIFSLFSGQGLKKKKKKKVSKKNKFKKIKYY